MLKEKVVVKCSKEQMFSALIEDFKTQYVSIKQEDLEDEKIVKGFTFTRELPKKKDKSVEVNYATYKVIACDRPYKFAMEYTSKTFHKVISTEISEVDDSHIQVLFATFQEKLKDQKPTKDFGEDVIVAAKLKTRWAINKMAREARKKGED